MPCFGRPERTKRAIEGILLQTVNNWQAYIIGDCCPDFQKIMEENRGLGDNSWEVRAVKQGNEIVMFNAKVREGGYGFAIRNFFNQNNNAEFLLYLDNDDIINLYHFEHYLKGIDGTDNDFVYFNSMKWFLLTQPDWVGNSTDLIRITKLENGAIGHAELIIRSGFLKENPGIQENSEYGHDWDFIQQMINAGAKYTKAQTGDSTYKIMGAGELREKNID